MKRHDHGETPDTQTDTSQYTRTAREIARADEERARQLAHLVRDRMREPVKAEPPPPCGDECDAPRVARGMCMAHYQMWRRFGTGKLEARREKGRRIDARLEQLVNDGLTAKEAAAACGISMAAAHARLSRLRKKKGGLQ